MEIEWRRSSRREGGMCVEVCAADGVVRVRDSKLGEASPVLSFTPQEWAAFLAGATAGEFNVSRLAR